MATSCSDDHSLEKRLEVAEELLAKAYDFRLKGIIQGIQRIEKQTKAEIAMLKKVSDLLIILSMASSLYRFQVALRADPSKETSFKQHKPASSGGSLTSV